jgi:hypothetical protein
MAKRVFNKILLLVIVFTISISCFAQGDIEVGKTSSGPRKQLATIVFSGLAGAVLGLSTLSFYGRPQDKLSNIAVGFAIGIISGTIYTTYKTATHPYGGILQKEKEFLVAQEFQPEYLSNEFNYTYSWSF